MGKPIDGSSIIVCLWGPSHYRLSNSIVDRTQQAETVKLDCRARDKIKNKVILLSSRWDIFNLSANF